MSDTQKEPPVFGLSIRLSNAAFHDEHTGEPFAGPEVARILRELATHLEHQDVLRGDLDLVTGSTGALFDYNGNRVGGWFYIPEREGS